jgi:ankyrin repeat protein
VKVDFQEPKFGNTLLMLAVANNKKKSVKKLLERGANPNVKDYYDNTTPFLYACENYSGNCDSTIVNWMLNFGGDPNTLKTIDRVESTGSHTIVKSTALMIAAKNNCIDIVKVLLNAGADINQYTYYEGYGAITEALVQDNLEIAKYLIIDRQAKIPAYCYVRTNTDKKLTITDMLNEQHYNKNSYNYKVKEEILSYLKGKGLN